MWRKVKKYFARYPAQEKIAKLMLTYGLSVREGRIFCGDIEVPALRIAKSVGVDRREIHQIIRTIEKNEDLQIVFERIKPIASLQHIIPVMGWFGVSIVPKDPNQPGILAAITKIIADCDISIRQAITEDPDFVEVPRILIITDREFPKEAMEKIKKLKSVGSVSVI